MLIPSLVDVTTKIPVVGVCHFIYCRHLAIRGGKRGFTLSVEPKYLEASTSMSVAPTGQGTADRPTTRPHRCFSGALQRGRGPHVLLLAFLPSLLSLSRRRLCLRTQPSTVTETQRATETGPATETQSETQTAMETQLVTETQPETQPSTETQPTTETQPGTQLLGPEEEPRSATFLVDDVDYECDITRAQASSKDEPTVAPPPSGNPRDEDECLREALKNFHVTDK